MIEIIETTLLIVAMFSLFIVLAIFIFGVLIPSIYDTFFTAGGCPIAKKVNPKKKSKQTSTNAK